MRSRIRGSATKIAVEYIVLMRTHSRCVVVRDHCIISVINPRAHLHVKFVRANGNRHVVPSYNSWNPVVRCVPRRIRNARSFVGTIVGIVYSSDDTNLGTVYELSIPSNVLSIVVFKGRCRRNIVNVSPWPCSIPGIRRTVYGYPLIHPIVSHNPGATLSVSRRRTFTQTPPSVTNSFGRTQELVCDNLSSSVQLRKRETVYRVVLVTEPAHGAKRGLCIGKIVCKCCHAGAAFLREYILQMINLHAFYNMVLSCSQAAICSIRKVISCDEACTPRIVVGSASTRVQSVLWFAAANVRHLIVDVVQCRYYTPVFVQVDRHHGSSRFESIIVRAFEIVRTGG